MNWTHRFTDVPNVAVGIGDTACGLVLILCMVHENISMYVSL